MNKGILMATGDIIGILNSDDLLANHQVLETIEKTFQKNKCDGTYSDLEIRDASTMKHVVRRFIAGTGNYKLGWYPPHPTLYLKKEIYQRFGNYNQDYRIAADYDFMIRIMKKPVELFYIPKTLIYMRSGGASTNGFKGYWKSFKESYNVLKKNHIRFALFVNLIRVWKIVVQKFKKS